MKIAKPFSLALLTRPLTQGGRHRLVIGALGFFRLGERNTRFLPEIDGWPAALKALPQGKPLDEVYPKPHGEVLLAGSAHAPDARPVDQLIVRLQVGEIDKRIRVWGDRRWYYGPWYRITEPTPFTTMPLVPARAYGGPKHPQNPGGTGYTGNPVAAWVGQNEGAMPNLEAPDEPVRGHVARLDAVGFGPLDPSLPPRAQWARTGTYDKRWLLEEAPGLPRDLDPRCFQTAPADQWRQNAVPWQGGEPYRLEHLHPAQPVIQGELPRQRVRALVRTHAAQDHEAEMALDTVWFVPESLLGVAIYHGTADIQDSDGLDVAAVLAGYEPAGAPRSRQHYQTVLTQRIQPETALVATLDDAPLVTPRSPEDDAQRRAARAAKQAAQLARRQAVLDATMDEIWARPGMRKPDDFVVPTLTQSSLELDLDAVLDGDADIGAWFKEAQAKAEQAKQHGEAQLHALQARQAAVLPAPAPPPDPQQEKNKIYQRASRVASDLVGSTQTVAPPARGARDEGEAHPARPGEEERESTPPIEALPALERQAWRAVLKPTQPQLAPELGTWLGERVRQWLLGGVCLAGRDLRGVVLGGLDLSGQDLRETCFESADLRGACLRGADLRGTSFAGAALDGADFTQARLDQANFSACHAHGARFDDSTLDKTLGADADFTGSSFARAMLGSVVWPRVVLTGAKLPGATLDQALLLEAKAAGSLWEGAVLTACILLKADLRQADFTGARLLRCVLLDAILDGGRWQRTHLERTLAIGASARQVDATQLRSKGSGFRKVVWQGADLRDALCNDSDFGEADFTGANLEQTLMTRCLLQGAVLHEARLARADLFQAVCRKGDFTGADLRETNLRQAALDGWRTDAQTRIDASTRLDTHVRERLARTAQPTSGRADS